MLHITLGRAMRTTCLAATLAATVAWANAATAAAPENLNQLLKGTYSETGTDACSYTVKGFDSTTKQPLSALILIQERSIFGTIVFNGDATGSADFGNVVTPILGNMIASVHATAPLTYDVASDRTVTIDTGPVTATVEVPPGGTYTVDHFTTSGMLSQDHRSLTQGAMTPEVETLTFATVSPLFRICSRSLVLIKVSDELE
jgi:hypothetical protein